jgi:hypothetical protein
LHKTGHERYLYLFTFFPHFYTPTNANDIDNLMDFFNQTYKNLSFATTNSTRLQSALAFCIHRGLEYCTGKNKACDSAYYYAGRYPNFIALDFVNEGKPMNIINKINTMPHKDEIFKPMPGIATSKKK